MIVGINNLTKGEICMKKIVLFCTCVLGIITLLSCSNGDDNEQDASSLTFAEENAECQYNSCSSTHVTTNLTKCTIEYNVWCILIKTDEQPKISRSEEWAYDWKLYRDSEKRNLWHLHINIPNIYGDLQNTFTISNSHGTITWELKKKYNSVFYEIADQEPIYCWDLCDPYLVFSSNATAHSKVNGSIESSPCYIYKYPRDGKLYVSGEKSERIHVWNAFALTKGKDPWGYGCSYYADVDGDLVYIKP